MRGNGTRSAGFLACLIVAALPLFASAPSMDECDAWVRRAPDDPEAYFCFLRAARAHGQADEAARRLQAILSVNPERHRARLNLAAVEDMRGNRAVAEKHYLRAADGLHEDDDPAGEVYARRGVAFLLGEQGRLDEADEQLEAASRAADRADSPGLRAWVWTDQATRWRAPRHASPS